MFLSASLELCIFVFLFMPHKAIAELSDFSVEKWIYNVVLYIYIYIYIYIYLYIYIDIYIYIFIYIYIHIHVFRPSQDSSVWLELTSGEQLMSPECSKHQVLKNYKKTIIKNRFIGRFKSMTFKYWLCHNLHNS